MSLISLQSRIVAMLSLAFDEGVEFTGAEALERYEEYYQGEAPTNRAAVEAALREAVKQGFLESRDNCRPIRFRVVGVSSVLDISPRDELAVRRFMDDFGISRADIEKIPLSVWETLAKLSAFKAIGKLS